MGVIIPVEKPAERCRRMKKLSLVLLLLALAPFSRAQLVMFSGYMDGAQAGKVTPGFGTLSGSINTATNLFILDFSFSNLLAPETAAHIHRGAPGVNGPVVIGAPSFPLGSPVHFETTITDALETDLLAGNLYLNVHTSLNPSGEIRGQLIPVPEPSTYALAGAALLGVIAYTRRRSKAAAVNV